MNIYVQRRQLKAESSVLTADYGVRNGGLHFQQGIDVNHVGDSRYLNTTAATNAINATLDIACGVTDYRG